MQNTRLSTIISVSVGRISQWSRNPWRRTSFILISLLLGFFLASVISTVSGAKSEQDVVTAAVVVLIVELTNRYVYGAKRVTSVDGSLAPRLLTTEILNSIKLGLVYGLFLEAFKLGS
ncbi:hypothetical protein APA_2271 [Pseudanabaena sp. lw0831]|uniref:DUF565 domain-containing protein n=1 Tax=Pseudanabaena sp. lw0831 TaxID=1357935 RepID=UPI001916C881|nr:DUF565 domain-containing protein [Pseudanabaena sp. lw0831]GBO54323.1 hypothetical protein APA_2271 [Pseudanabaena sp. lw0831]